jgi:hypothetical protein
MEPPAMRIKSLNDLPEGAKRRNAHLFPMMFRGDGRTEDLPPPAPGTPAARASEPPEPPKPGAPASKRPINDPGAIRIREKSRPVSLEDRLTKTEREFLLRLRAGVYGKVDWIGIQCLTLKLADDCRYTPDCVTCQAGQIRLWEIKGAHIWEDSMVKLKVAARTFPFFTFVRAQKKDGTWTEKIIDQ